MPKAKTERLEIRTTVDLRARLEAEAEQRGQSMTVFVTRALEAALSEAKGGGVRPSRPAGAPIPSGSPATDGVRPAASPRTSRTNPANAGRVHSARCRCAVCKPPKKAKA